MNWVDGVEPQERRESVDVEKGFKTSFIFSNVLLQKIYFPAIRPRTTPQMHFSRKLQLKNFKSSTVHLKDSMQKMKKELKTVHCYHSVYKIVKKCKSFGPRVNKLTN